MIWHQGSIFIRYSCIIIIYQHLYSSAFSAEQSGDIAFKIAKLANSYNWIKIELFSVLSVFSFLRIFSLGTISVPFFLSFFHTLILSTIPRTFLLSTRGFLSMVNLKKDFKRLPYVRERNSTIWIFILIKSSKSISCFQEHITVVPLNIYSTSVVLVLYLLA